MRGIGLAAGIGWPDARAGTKTRNIASEGWIMAKDKVVENGEKLLASMTKRQKANKESKCDLLEELEDTWTPEARKYLINNKAVTLNKQLGKLRDSLWDDCQAETKAKLDKGRKPSLKDSKSSIGGIGSLEDEIKKQK